MSPELRARLTAMTRAQIETMNGQQEPPAGFFVHARDMWEALHAIAAAPYGDRMREIAEATIRHVQNPWRKD